MGFQRQNRNSHLAVDALRSPLGVKRYPVGLLAAALALGLAALAPHSAAAQKAASVFQSEGGAVQQVVLTLNKSRTFSLDRAFTSAVVGNPEIADARPISSNVIYVQAKKIGTTNLVAFDADMKVIGVMDIEVVPDTGALQQKIWTTGSRGIRVSSANGQIILTGVAPSAVAAEQAVSIAKSLVPQGSTVVNATTVAPSQQVMLKVRFLEVSRQAARDLGVNWFVGNGTGTRGFNTGLGTPVVGNSTGVPLFRAASSLVSGGTPFGVALANLVNNGNSVDLMLSALETKGLIRRLAEPDLVALSGDTAAFLAGGEFPYPSIQSSSAGSAPVVTTQFKPFGVQLTFMPTVLANGIINLRLAPSVSELDFTNQVAVGGTLVPSLVKREASTTIELRDGQSFAIAGLLQSHDRRNISQLPWAGTVPVLGALFRSNDYQKDETDLVVIVTPHLVAPAPAGAKMASPLDKNIPTNDVDFFLLGQMEQRKNFQSYVTTGGGIEGPYGYILRTDPPPGAPPPAPAVKPVTAIK